MSVPPPIVDSSLAIPPAPLPDTTNYSTWGAGWEAKHSPTSYNVITTAQACGTVEEAGIGE